MGDPLRARPRHEPHRGHTKACRWGGRRSTTPRATATGAGSCPATRNIELSYERCSCGRTTLHVPPTSSATARSRAAMTTASPAPRPRRPLEVDGLPEHDRSVTAHEPRAPKVTGPRHHRRLGDDGRPRWRRFPDAEPGSRHVTACRSPPDSLGRPVPADLRRHRRVRRRIGQTLDSRSTRTCRWRARPRT